MCNIYPSQKCDFWIPCLLGLNFSQGHKFEKQISSLSFSLWRGFLNIISLSLISYGCFSNNLFCLGWLWPLCALISTPNLHMWTLIYEFFYIHLGLVFIHLDKLNFCCLLNQPLVKEFNLSFVIVWFYLSKKW